MAYRIHLKLRALRLYVSPPLLFSKILFQSYIYLQFKPPWLYMENLIIDCYKNDTMTQLLAECLFVACCVYRLWPFLLTARCSLGTVLIGMKPEVHCTFVASVVPLLIGIVKKVWPISHFLDRVNGQPTWLLMLTTLCPSRASEWNLAYCQGRPHSNHRPDTKLVAKSLL